MNAVLEQIYATILPSAPFVIAAYALMWAILCAFVVGALVKLKRTETSLKLLEESLKTTTENRNADVLKSAQH